MNESAGKTKKSSPLIPVLILVTIGIGIWIFDSVKDDIFPKRFGVVKEGVLYRSGQISSTLVKRVLEEHNIQVIIDLTGTDPSNSDQVAEIQTAKELGIERCTYPLSGKGTGDVNSYIQALCTLHQAIEDQKPALIHCAAGTQRTGGATALYRLLFEKQSPESVVEEMKHYDWSYRDNPDLLDYLNKNMPVICNALHEKGVLDEIPDPIPVLQP